jgi:5-methylcytosine-specific restriction protein A
VTVAYDALLDPNTRLLHRESLADGPLASVHWSTQGGGISIPPEAIAVLESVWDAHVRSHGLYPQPLAFPDAGELIFPEGAPRAVTVQAFERSAAARSACIAQKGTACSVCELDFGRAYGQIGSGFIHVHHTRPLSGGGGRQRHTTVNDLEPVCPNCHNMIHRRSPPYGIQELRDIMRQQAESHH